VTPVRVPLGFVVTALVFYLSVPVPISIITGLPVALLGLVFRALAAGVIQKNSVLATIGLYQFSRNPLYLGSFLLVSGFAIMSCNITAAALLLIPFTLVYTLVIREEEGHMKQIFGEEFEQYRAAVPQFFPRNLNKSILHAFSLRQYLANREYNAGLGFVGATLILLTKFFMTKA